ncbi:hypothetical protein [Legionella fairfieldensis]|uniref:hypothetical protein n=1 Tax=Legionella fairfieldensis TaxID=45064 RepID=UPI00049193A2|nr:hypothetical protein [Legionella fairfieldensis]
MKLYAVLSREVVEMIGSEEDSKNNHLDNYETLFFYKEASGVLVAFQYYPSFCKPLTTLKQAQILSNRFARYEKELYEKDFIAQIILEYEDDLENNRFTPTCLFARFTKATRISPSRWRKHIIVSEENVELDEKTSLPQENCLEWGLIVDREMMKSFMEEPFKSS